MKPWDLRTSPQASALPFCRDGPSKKKLPTRNCPPDAKVWDRSYHFPSPRLVRYVNQNGRLHKMWQQSIQIDIADTYSNLSLNARSSGFLLLCCKLKKLDPSKGYKLKLLLLSNTRLPADFPFFFSDFVAKSKNNYSDFCW